VVASKLITGSIAERVGEIQVAEGNFVTIIVKVEIARQNVDVSQENRVLGGAPWHAGLIPLRDARPAIPGGYRGVELPSPSSCRFARKFEVRAATAGAGGQRTYRFDALAQSNALNCTFLRAARHREFRIAAAIRRQATHTLG